MDAGVVAQAGTPDLAAWAEVIRAVSPILGAFIALAGVIFSIWHAGRRDDARMKNDRELKDRDLGAVREDRLRDERRLAYAHLVTAAWTIRMEETQLVEGIVRVSESTAETQLVAGSEKVKEAALDLNSQHRDAALLGERLRKASKNPNEDGDFQNSMKALETAMLVFLDAAREELGIARSTPLDDTPGTSTDSRP